MGNQDPAPRLLLTASPWSHLSSFPKLTTAWISLLGLREGHGGWMKAVPCNHRKGNTEALCQELRWAWLGVIHSIQALFPPPCPLTGEASALWHHRVRAPPGFWELPGCYIISPRVSIRQQLAIYWIQKDTGNPRKSVLTTMWIWVPTCSVSLRKGSKLSGGDARRTHVGKERATLLPDGPGTHPSVSSRVQESTWSQPLVCIGFLTHDILILYSSLF